MASFFFTGVKQTAEQAVKTARTLLQLFDADQRKLHKLGRAANSALRIHSHLQKKPLASIARISQAVHLSQVTVGSALRHLQKLGIVREVTGGKYGRLYSYSGYLKILEEEVS